MVLTYFVKWGIGEDPKVAGTHDGVYEYEGKQCALIAFVGSLAFQGFLRSLYRLLIVGSLYRLFIVGSLYRLFIVGSLYRLFIVGSLYRLLMF